MADEAHVAGTQLYQGAQRQLAALRADLDRQAAQVAGLQQERLAAQRKAQMQDIQVPS